VQGGVERLTDGLPWYGALGHYSSSITTVNLKWVG